LSIGYHRKTNLGLNERLGEISSLGSSKSVEIILKLLLRLSVDTFRVGGGEVDAAPIGAVEDGGGADVEEDDGVAGANVVVNGPLDSEGALVGEINCDGDLPGGAGGGSVDAGARPRGNGGGHGNAWGRRASGGLRLGFGLHSDRWDWDSNLRIFRRSWWLLLVSHRRSFWFPWVSCQHKQEEEEEEKKKKERESMWRLLSNGEYNGKVLSFLLLQTSKME